MTLSVSLALLRCPSCGEIIVPSGMQIGMEPEHLTATCDYCKKIVEITRDPASGKMVPKVAKKN